MFAIFRFKSICISRILFIHNISVYIFSLFLKLSWSADPLPSDVLDRYWPIYTPIRSCRCKHLEDLDGGKIPRNLAYDCRSMLLNLTSTTACLTINFAPLYKDYHYSLYPEFPCSPYDAAYIQRRCLDQTVFSSTDEYFERPGVFGFDKACVQIVSSSPYFQPSCHLPPHCGKIHYRTPTSDTVSSYILNWMGYTTRVCIGSTPYYAQITKYQRYNLTIPDLCDALEMVPRYNYSFLDGQYLAFPVPVEPMSQPNLTRMEFVNDQDLYLEFTNLDYSYTGYDISALSRDQLVRSLPLFTFMPDCPLYVHPDPYCPQSCEVPDQITRWILPNSQVIYYNVTDTGAIYDIEHRWCAQDPQPSKVNDQVRYRIPHKEITIGLLEVFGLFLRNLLFELIYSLIPAVEAVHAYLFKFLDPSGHLWTIYQAINRFATDLLLNALMPFVAMTPFDLKIHTQIIAALLISFVHSLIYFIPKNVPT